MLGSLAFQMAEASYEVRRAIVSKIEDGVKVSNDSHHILWTKLFVDCIFRLESLKPQFWVLDAVDECHGNGVPSLVAMLSKLERRVPVRVFLTSRPGGQLERLLLQEKVSFKELRTGQAGSLSDIERFLHAKFPQLGDREAYQGFLSNALSKSNGIFLWASLIVARLESIYSMEDMQEAFQAIPSEMEDLYSRITDSILSSPSGELARCILKWVTCSPRPLSIGELMEAVKLDIDRTLTASPGGLEAMTGHLVFLDSHAMVHIAHETTSNFLTREREGLWIDQPVAHARAAEVCLMVLCGREFAPPRTRRASGSTAKKSHGALATYASTYFGYHLVHSSSSVDALLGQLNRFLRSNVLTWIERLAESGNLSVLRQTSQRLKAYLARQAKDHPPVSPEVQTVSAWAKDLHQIVAAFHTALLASPSSIHFLIPYFCPETSITRQLFAKPTKRLRIAGQLDEEWSDRLTSYVFPAQATSVACCERLLAVGLKTGHIRLHDTAGFGTFESVGTLVHGRRVQQLAFDPASSYLVSCSARKLILWDVRRPSSPSFACLWARDLNFTPDQVLFNTEGDLIMLSDPGSSTLVTFRTTDGFRNKDLLLQSLPDSDSSDSAEQPGSSWVSAQLLRVNSAKTLAALSYRNSLVSIWDLEGVEKIGNFEREGCESVYSSPPTLDMVFNPIPELELLAISYKDGNVVLCNPWTLEQLGKCHLPYSLNYLASTSDGRVLAGGADDGIIHLVLFETLQPLYCVQPPDQEYQLHGLTFSADNLRLFEIRREYCTIWEPLALMMKEESDDSSSELPSEQSAMQGPSLFARFFEWSQAITAIEATDRGVFFVGRKRGTIDVCDGSTGDLMEAFRIHHASAQTKHMSWIGANNLLLHSDLNNRCTVNRWYFDLEKKQSLAFLVLDHREREEVIRQALLRPDGTSVLLRTDSRLKLISLDGGAVRAEVEFAATFCASHPSNPSLLIVFQPERVYVLEWNCLARLPKEEGIPMVGFDPSIGLFQMNGPWFGRAGSVYLLQFFDVPSYHTICLGVLDASKLTPETKEADIQVRALPKLHIRAVVGVLKSTLYFLEATGWVCSVGLKNWGHATHYTRHFFIPPTWHMGDVAIGMISKTAVAFAMGMQVIIFHGFVELEEKVPFEEL
jgi:WD40 repeat protein